MKTRQTDSGFALAVTLVLMALIVVVVVAYLGNTRTDRSTSSLYANRLRAKIIADSALSAAMTLLYENTKYGNYITAMPAPSPPGSIASPTPIRTELYRPVHPAPSPSPVVADYLRLDNAIGEVLVSRADSAALSAPTPQVDPRPAPTPLALPAAGGSWGLPDPGFTAADSYDFNQIVRVGENSSGRLIHPDGQPAHGQWVRVRNSSGQLVGRYAFFIEDESMKVNVDVSGNAQGSPHLRLNDLTTAPASTPASQVQEIDPTAVLPTDADRASASSALTGLGGAGARLPTKATTALLTEWNAPYPDIAHLVTVVSKDDDTTARGWSRMDLNKLVKDAEDKGTNAAKADAAKAIAAWIETAWSGLQPISDLREDADGRRYQLYNDERLRFQIAANIVDYIDSDNVPTDVGDTVPSTGMMAVPVLGIEKIPYLGAVMVIYRAADRTAAAPDATGRAQMTAKLSMKVRFNFINLFEQDLKLDDVITAIEVKNVPSITKLSQLVWDPTPASGDTFTIPVASLTPVAGSGNIIPAGVNNSSGTGVRSFETDWLLVDQVKTFRDAVGNPTFNPVEEMSVAVLGPDGAKLDVTAMTWSDTPSPTTGFRQSGTTTPGSSSAGDFLRDDPATKPGVARQIAAIFMMESSVPSGSGTLNRQFGDPRYRPMLLNERWRRVTRSDTESAFTASALDARRDTVDMQLRTAAFDWYDEVSNRPLAFIRNGPMRGIGELGHISASEYPWRTLYMQHPDRPSNSTSAIVVDEVATKRRMNSIDWVLADLFKTSDQDTRSGAININTQLTTSSEHKVLNSLFLGMLIGDTAATQQTISNDKSLLITTEPPSGSPAPAANRRGAVATPLPDNDPIRPFFQIGELAPILSRLFSSSVLNDSIENGPGGTSRSTVTYSVLRSSPSNVNELSENYRSDLHVEQAFREVSNAVTTRGNVFRVLYVGQTIKDQKDATGQFGNVESNSEVAAEFLGEAFVERVPVFTTTSTAKITSDSRYRLLMQRAITE